METKAPKVRLSPIAFLESKGKTSRLSPINVSETVVFLEEYANLKIAEKEAENKKY